jgi:SAM-dependent methyltransferase
MLNRSTDGGRTWSLNGRAGGIPIVTVLSDQAPYYKFCRANALLGGVDALAVDPATGELSAPLGAVANLAGGVLALARAFGGRSVATAEFATRDPDLPLTIAGREGEPIVVAAGEQLPYPSGLFDAVVCMDVLEHVADVELVLCEIRRVLKPGGLALTSVPNRHAFRDPHYHLPIINWVPRPLAELVIRRTGRSKRGGPLRDRQELSALNTYTWSGFKRLASGLGFKVRDQVRYRIARGEIRQLRGWKRLLLDFLLKTGLAWPLYSAYRFGWQGTYQILLVKQGSGVRGQGSGASALTQTLTPDP